MSVTAKRFAFDLKSYIGDEQSSCIQANSCDYKGTGQYELDRIKADAERGFQFTCKLLDSMSSAEQAKLRKYAKYRLNTEYFRFTSFLLRNNDPEIKNGLGEQADRIWYVGPSWLSVYDDFVKARELTS